MCEVHGGSFCCRKSVALIQKSTLGFFWCMKFCFWGIAGFFSTLGERYFFFFLSLLISCISKLLILNISEGHIREEVYVAISNSFPCPSISAHARNNTSCVLKILASYSIFWQEKIAGGVGTFQKYGEQVPVLVCDRLFCLEGTNMYWGTEL